MDGSNQFNRENLKYGAYTYTASDANSQSYLGSVFLDCNVKWSFLKNANVDGQIFTNTSSNNGYGNSGAFSTNELPKESNGFIQYKVKGDENNFAFGFGNCNDTMVGNLHDIEYSIVFNENRIFVAAGGAILSELGRVEPNEYISIRKENGGIGFFINDINMFDLTVLEFPYDLRAEIAMGIVDQTIYDLTASFFRKELSKSNSFGYISKEYPESGYASVTGLDGLPPYNYKWYTNPISANNMITNLALGEYRCTVKDSKGDSLVMYQTISHKVDFGSRYNISMSNEGISKINPDEPGVLFSKNYLESNEDGWVEFKVNNINANQCVFLNGFDDQVDEIPHVWYDVINVTLTANYIPNSNSEEYNLLNIVDDSNYPNSIIVRKNRFLDFKLSEGNRTILTNCNGIIINDGQLFIIKNGSTINKPILISNGQIFRLQKSSSTFKVKRDGSVIYTSNVTYDQPVRFGFGVGKDFFGIDVLGTSTGNPVSRINAICAASNNKNWTYDIFYDGANNIVSESVTFFDVLGRNLQSQKKIQTTQEVIATQTIYDAFGRVVLNTLPAPINSGQFCYTDNFIRNEENGPYTHEDFDKLSYINAPKPVSTNCSTSKLGCYYSENNMLEKYVGTTPTPYSRVEYSQSNPGSILKSSSAGVGLNHGSGHEQYNFTMKTAGELYYFYGFLNSWKILDMSSHFFNYTPCRAMDNVVTEPIANLQNSTLKSISLDEEGKETVSFFDAKGNLIGTCLAGMENGANQQVQSLVDYIEVGPNSLYNYIDIHLPEGCQNSLVLEQPLSGTPITYDVYSLKNEKYPTSAYYGHTGDGSALAINPGFYRIKARIVPASYHNLIKVRYNTNYYNFTANYYDKANRLRIVVPPKGIDYSGGAIAANPVHNGSNAKTFARWDATYTSSQNGVNTNIVPTWYLNAGSGGNLDQVIINLPNNSANSNLVHNFAVAFSGKSTFNINLGNDNGSNASGAYRTQAGESIMASGDMVAARYTIDETDKHYTQKEAITQLNSLPILTPTDALFPLYPVQNRPPGGTPVYSTCNQTVMPVEITYQLFDQNNIAISGSNLITGYCTIVNCPGVSYSRSWSFPTPNLHQLANGCNASSGNIVKLKILTLKVIQTPNNSNGSTVFPPFNFISDITAFLNSTTGTKAASPGHNMTELYEYDCLGQVIRSKKPDSGTMDYNYNQYGETVFTQNSKQDLYQTVASGQIGDKFSYVNSDEYGRPTESGEYWSAYTSGSSAKVLFQNINEYPSGVPSGLVSSIDLANNNANINETMRTKEKSFIVYDYADPNFVSETGINIPSVFYQDYVAGNISYSYNSEKKSWYSYDEYGRTKWVVQKYFNIPDGSQSYTIKSFYYTYDFLGNVIQTDFQAHLSTTIVSDKMKQNFFYDADKRLVKTNSTIYATSNPQTKTNAEYFYYTHGLLKRKQLANNLQGIDYVYTVNGWLKNMNAPELDVTHDPGKDGKFVAYNGKISHKDLFGLSLEYYNNDYVRPSTSIQNLYNIAGTYSGNGQTVYLPNYYTGKIKAMRWQTREPIANSGMSYQNQQMTYTYFYDKKDQLKEARFGSNGHLFNDDYKVSNISYDLNGNILSLSRNAYAAGPHTLNMDNMTYHYTSCTNKLDYVSDNIYYGASDPYPGVGFKKGQTAGNYAYNVLGENESDVNENKYYEYNAWGNITSVKNVAGNPLVEYFYDGAGHRFLKKSYANSTVLNTFYVRDNAGNIVCTYERTGTSGNYSAKEWDIYGDSRLATAYLNGSNLDYVYNIDDHLGSNRTTFKEGLKQTFVPSITIPNADDQYLLDPNNSLGTYNGQQYSIPNVGMGVCSTLIPVYPGDVITASVLANYIHPNNSPIPASGVGIFIQIQNPNGTNYSQAWMDMNPSGFNFQILNNLNLVYPSTVNDGIQRYLRVFVRNAIDGFAAFNGLGFNINGQGGMPVPQQLEVSNYYPHGSPMPGLTYNASTMGGRHTYQGQFAENDKEINEQFFELRNYDPLITRFKSIDPYEQYHSPYLAMGNSHPNQIDPDGGFSPMMGAVIGAAVGGAIGAGIVLANRDNMSREAMFTTVAGGMVAGALVGGFGGDAISFIGKHSDFMWYTIKETVVVTNEVVKRVFADMDEGHDKHIFIDTKRGGRLDFDAFFDPDHLILKSKRGTNDYDKDRIRFSRSLTINPYDPTHIDVLRSTKGSIYSLSYSETQQKVNITRTKCLFGVMRFNQTSSSFYDNPNNGGRAPGSSSGLKRHRNGAKAGQPIHFHFKF
jgi:hypothetical protein